MYKRIAQCNPSVQWRPRAVNYAKLTQFVYSMSIPGANLQYVGSGPSKAKEARTNIEHMRVEHLYAVIKRGQFYSVPAETIDLE